MLQNNPACPRPQDLNEGPHPTFLQRPTFAPDQHEEAGRFQPTFQLKDFPSHNDGWALLYLIEALALQTFTTGA